MSRVRRVCKDLLAFRGAQQLASASSRLGLLGFGSAGALPCQEPIPDISRPQQEQYRRPGCPGLKCFFLQLLHFCGFLPVLRRIAEEVSQGRGVPLRVRCGGSTAAVSPEPRRDRLQEALLRQHPSVDCWLCLCVFLVFAAARCLTGSADIGLFGQLHHQALQGRVKNWHFPALLTGAPRNGSFLPFTVESRCPLCSCESCGMFSVAPAPSCNSMEQVLESLHLSDSDRAKASQSVHGMRVPWSPLLMFVCVSVSAYRYWRRIRALPLPPEHSKSTAASTTIRQRLRQP